MGIILCALVVGEKPFEQKSITETYKAIKIGKYSFPEDCQISEDLKDLIQKILVGDVNKRIKLEEILNHNFLKYKNNIPASLPISTLRNPPDIEFIKQYGNNNSIRLKKEKENENDL